MQIEKLNIEDKQILKKRLSQQVMPATGIILMYSAFWFGLSYTLLTLDIITSDSYPIVLGIGLFLLIGIVIFFMKNYVYDLSDEFKYIDTLKLIDKRTDIVDLREEEIMSGISEKPHASKTNYYLNFEDLTISVSKEEYYKVQVNTFVKIHVGSATRQVFKAEPK